MKKRRFKTQKPSSALTSRAGRRPDEDAGKKTLFTLLLSCALFVTLYFTGWHFHDTKFYPFSIAVEIGLYVLLGVLLLAFIMVNRGVSTDIPTPDQLSASMSAAEKEAFIDEISRRRKRARPLLYMIFPLVFIVGFDMVYTLLFT